jgi:hypothetical protein
VSENVWQGVLAVGGGFALLFGLLLIGLRSSSRASTGTRAAWELALCAVGVAAMVALLVSDGLAISQNLGTGASWNEAGLGRMFAPLGLAAVLLRMIWVRLPSVRRAGRRGTSA